MMFLLLLLLLGGSVYGQSDIRQVIATQGGSGVASSMLIDWTVGQIATETVTDENSIYTQGFQQPDLTVSEIPIESQTPIAMSVFPNPTEGRVVLNIEKPHGEAHAYLYDLGGKLLWSKAHVSTVEEIDLSKLPNAAYLLRIDIPEDQSSRAFQVQKIR